MKDQDCISFLQWVLPQLNYRWKGFRKVRNQVCKRIQRRINDLELNHIHQYSEYLGKNTPEWYILENLLYVTISRFFRDPQIFQCIQDDLFPEIIQNSFQRNEKSVNFWSIGCCSGEEPYSLNIIWKLSNHTTITGGLIPNIIGTDFRPALLERAKQARYPTGSLKYLPQPYLEAAFIQENDHYRLKQEFQRNIKFIKQDIRKQVPSINFDLILCRNLVFTYFEKQLQIKILSKITRKLNQNGFLIIGSHERLPELVPELNPYRGNSIIFQKLLRK